MGNLITTNLPPGTRIRHVPTHTTSYHGWEGVVERYDPDDDKLTYYVRVFNPTGISSDADRFWCPVEDLEVLDPQEGTA